MIEPIWLLAANGKYICTDTWEEIRRNCQLFASGAYWYKKHFLNNNATPTKKFHNLLR
jgi:hypothetical protein